MSRQLVSIITKDLMRRIKDPSIGQRETWKKRGIGIAPVIDQDLQCSVCGRVKRNGLCRGCDQDYIKVQKLASHNRRKAEALQAEFAVGKRFGHLEIVGGLDFEDIRPSVRCKCLLCGRLETQYAFMVKRYTFAACQICRANNGYLSKPRGLK